MAKKPTKYNLKSSSTRAIKIVIDLATPAATLADVTWAIGQNAGASTVTVVVIDALRMVSVKTRSEIPVDGTDEYLSILLPTALIQPPDKSVKIASKAIITTRHSSMSAKTESTEIFEVTSLNGRAS